MFQGTSKIQSVSKIISVYNNGKTVRFREGKWSNKISVSDKSFEVKKKYPPLLAE